MRTAIIVFFVTFLFAGTVLASACDTPESTAKTYIEFDFKGYRLGADVSAPIDELETENKFEPAWDVATLITGYEIKSVKQTDKKATVTILFKKSWEVARKFKKDKVRNEIVEMHLKKEKSCWKVSPPFYPPHVYSESLETHLNKLIQSDSASAGKDWLEYTQSQLDGIVQYRKAQQPATDGHR